MTSFRAKPYDVVIVGAGPSGITAAFVLATMGQRVLLIERERAIGGCHRPTYVTSRGVQWFTEHGPRLYSKSFVNMFALLKSMGIDGPSLFTDYKFSSVHNLWQEIRKLKWFEIWHTLTAVALSKINSNYGRDMSVLAFCSKNRFTAPSMEFFDGVCRLVDGGNASRTSWYEFLQLLGGQIVYSNLQPVLPNDKGLLALMHQSLVQAGVDIWLGTSVHSITIASNSQTVQSFRTEGNHVHALVRAKRMILAIPPESLVTFLTSVQGVPASFVNAFSHIDHLRQWARNHAYNPDLSLTLHWDSRIDNLPSVWGFPTGSDWGVAWIVMSDYMSFDNTGSTTLMSVVITKPDGLSKNLSNRTCHQISDRQKILGEAIMQIQKRYADLANFHLPVPQSAFLNPGVVRSQTDKKWEVTDKSFLDRPGYSHLEAASPMISNLYSLGTHNGHSTYKFTSFESAVENAISLCHDLVPASMQRFPLHKRI